ncbi:MAG TPA: hypothetical protein DCL54_18290 [Alphaproteobacteria bacterium]|nr:hypothetical protein [Alphaproteobacteria bacterium]HAJ48531.1 hypothetical protein [Alphaproteobacteria bacterium]
MSGWLQALLAAAGQWLERVLTAALAYAAGRWAQRAVGLDEQTKVQDEQARIAADGPRTRDELVRRVRDEGL